jgi:glutamine synthetase
MRYQGQLAATCVSLKAIGYKFDTLTLDRITDLVKELQDGIAALEVAMARHDFADTLGHATHACDAICPAMLTLRKAADELEGIVADDLWPLATYQEMLFIK